MAEPRQDGRTPYTGLRFDGTNFDSWQFGVKLVIQSEELWATSTICIIMYYYTLLCEFSNICLIFWNSTYIDTHTTGVVCVKRGLPHSQCENKGWISLGGRYEDNDIPHWKCADDTHTQECLCSSTGIPWPWKSSNPNQGGKIKIADVLYLRSRNVDENGDTYSKSATDSASLLWSQFLGCKSLPGQTVVELITEIEHVVSRLRENNMIVLLPTIW